MRLRNMILKENGEIVMLKIGIKKLAYSIQKKFSGFMHIDFGDSEINVIELCKTELKRDTL